MPWRPSAAPNEPPAGDAARFDAVVLVHLQSGYALARWLVRDPTLAQDVVQDAVLRALGYLGSFRGGDARAWFLRIVRNVAYDGLARQRTAGAQELGEAAESVADAADDPEAALLRRERGATLERCLEALAPELRECLVLKELEGLSYRQISEVTGVPIGTVMSRLWRARQALTAKAEHS